MNTLDEVKAALTALGDPVTNLAAVNDLDQAVKALNPKLSVVRRNDRRAGLLLGVCPSGQLSVLFTRAEEAWALVHPDDLEEATR